MAAAAHVFPKYDLDALNRNANLGTLNSSTVLVAGLIHSSSPAVTWNSTSQGYQTVSDFLANGGSALTEESGTGYSRLTLTSVTCTASAAVVTLTCASPIQWTTSTISATYLWIHDATTNTSDSTRQLVLYMDFGGTFTDTAGTFSVAVNASGLATWTSN